jgi:hypothetical protein
MIPLTWEFLRAFGVNVLAFGLVLAIGAGILGLVILAGVR